MKPSVMFLVRQSMSLVAAAALVLLTGSATNALAQSSVSASVGGALDAYREGEAASTRRQKVNGSAGFEHLFDHERARIFYDLDGGTFDSPGDWSYYLNTAGFTYRFGGPDASARHVYLNGSFVTRLNGDGWSNADYSAFGVGINGEFHPRENVSLRTGYRADHRAFHDYSALTQTEQRAFSSLLANFESRTTLIVEVQFGAKAYAGQVVGESRVVEVPIATSSSGSPTGQGKSRGMGPGVRLTSVVVPQTLTQDGTAGLAIGMIRIAQSLSDRTGVRAQASVRSTFGSVASALVTTPAGFFDDGVYDDPFASNAVNVQAGLTRAFHSGAEIEASASWADKRYTNTPALDADWNELAGSPLRRDRVWRGGVMWSQPVLAAHTGRTGLTLDIGYRFTQSRSNDVFYDYASHGVSLGFTVNY